MPQELLLRDIEKRTFRSTFQDGLWDIFIGFVALEALMMWSMTDIGLPSWSFPVV